MAGRRGSHAGINGTVNRRDLRPAPSPSAKDLLSRAGAAATQAERRRLASLSPAERELLATREARRKGRSTG